LSKKVGIVARTDRKEAISVAAQIVDRFESEKFNVLMEHNLAELLNRHSSSTPLEKMKVDLIVTIGGDGTILRTCLRIPKPEPPILAVDMGVRGFLTEVTPEKSLEAIEKYLKGTYSRRAERGFRYISTFSKASAHENKERRRYRHGL